MGRASRTLLVMLVLGAASAAAGWQYRIFLGIAPAPSEDLPGHAALVSRLLEQLAEGRIRFYDSTSFTGWPAFYFYGFVAHLLAAAVAPLLDGLWSWPSYLAVQWLSYLCLIALPFSIHYASTPFARALFIDRDTAPLPLLHALIVSALALWFMLLDDRFFGLGAGGALLTGLFPQALAWHLLLWHLGLLVRTIQSERPPLVRLSIVFTLLLLAHAQTALYAGALAFCAFIFCPSLRKHLAGAHLLAGGCAGFWLVPLLVLSPTFIPGDPYPPGGDLFATLFRYPLQLVLSALRSGELPALHVAHLLLLCTAVVLACSSRVRLMPLVSGSAVAVLLIHLLTGSTYVAASIPLGLHYYRMHSYTVLALLPLLAAVPMIGVSWASRRYLWTALAAASIATSIFIPSPGVTALTGSAATEAAAAREKVIELLQSVPPGERVYVEHLRDYGRYAHLGPHYIQSRLSAGGSVETLNGLLVESSLAYRFAVGTIDRLGGETFHNYLTFAERMNNDDQTSVAQLRSFGLRYVVTGEDALKKRLERFARQPAAVFGPYRVTELSGPIAPPVAPVVKPLVGYYDVKGSLPFTYLEYYLYSRDGLSEQLELIELPSLHGALPGLDLLILNVTKEEYEEMLPFYTLPETIAFDFTRGSTLRSDRRDYRIQQQIQRFIAAYDFLEGKIRLSNRIKTKLATAGLTSPPAKQPQITWDSAAQQFRLTSLAPKTLYRINYSYFPVFEAIGGRLFRGGTERMYLLATEEEAQLTFSSFNHWSGIAGFLATGCSLVAVIVALLHRRKHGW